MRLPLVQPGCPVLASIRELLRTCPTGPLGWLLAVCLLSGPAAAQPTTEGPAPSRESGVPPEAPGDADAGAPASPPADPDRPATDDPPGPPADGSTDPGSTPAEEAEGRSITAPDPDADSGAEQTSPAAPNPAEPDAAADGPAEVDLADPMGPVEAALDGLAAQGLAITGRRRTVSALQGEVLTATISGPESELMLYVFSQVADDGYQFLLAPVGPQSYELVVLRARAGQGRGVDFVNVDDVQIDGTFRGDEDSEELRKFTALPPGGVVPVEVTDELSTIGYEASISAMSAGGLRILVRPGRALRRVRVRGHVPLSERNVRRVLSPAARPGSLARGECVDPRTLRKARPESVCQSDDLACRQWERDEVDRLHRFLFDNGYLEGRASLGLSCGRDGEADLHVYVDKGRAFRVRKPKIEGNIQTRDQAWIRRMFRSTVSPFIPIGKRITRKDIEEATERVASEYSLPRNRARSTARRQLQLPYPGVRVETNFERLSREDLPERGRTLPLEVDVQLGNGVRVGFIGNEHVAESRLLDQMQMFKRREPASSAAAAREAENIRRYYQRRGYMFADVEAVFGDSGTLKTITFQITEGPRTSIREVGFELPQTVPRPVRRAIDRAYRQDRELGDGDRFSDAAARSDLATVLEALADRGYLCARAQFRITPLPDGFEREGYNATIDPLTELENAGHPTWIVRQLDASGLEALKAERRVGVYVRLEVDPGPRVLTSGREEVHNLELPIPPSREVDSIPEASEGAWGPARLLRDGPLRRRGDERSGGIPMRLDFERDVERDITSRLRGSGYPLADAEVRWSYTDPAGVPHSVTQADRLTSNSVGMCSQHADDPLVTIDTDLYVHEGRKATFGTTLIRGNFKTRRYLLRREINTTRKRPGGDGKWKEGDTYDARRVDNVRKHIEGTGTVSTAQIREQPTDCKFTDDPERPCVVHHVVTVQEAKDRLMDISWGFGGATLDPTYVFLAPGFPNIFGTGWDLQLDGHWGADLSQFDTQFCDGEACYERSARASFIHPRIFGSPLTFDISSQIQRRVTPARGQIDSLLGTVRFTWPVNDHLRSYVGYVIQAANISKDVAKPTPSSELGCSSSEEGFCRPPNRSEAIVPDLTGGVEIGAQYQDVDNAFNPDDGFIATADLLYASPALGGRDQWVRSELSWQHFVPIPGTRKRVNFRYMLRYGHAFPIRGLGVNTTSIPEVWRFFGGGTADLGIRGIEPQTMLVDIEEIEGPYGTLTLRPTAQGGHIRALGTAAVQVVSVRKFLGGKLAHSLFIDAGVLTQRWNHVIPSRDVRRSVGVNFVKWDIRIVTVALGYAVLVPNAVFAGNVRPTDDQNGRFVFDVGATF
ncbi:MAG: BamA/TamA family outer membrane protein [Nannocystales bacterium]